MDSDVRCYQLRPEAFETTAKRRIYRRLAWITAFLALMLPIELAVLARAQEGARESLPIAIPLIVVVLVLTMGRAVYVQLKTGRAAWSSYQLVVTPTMLRRFIVNLPPIEILRREVTRIVEVEAEGLTVQTADRHRFIFIPRQLIGFDGVRGQLSTWCAFEPTRLRWRVLGIGWSALFVGSWIASGVIPDLGLAMVAGAVLVAVSAFAIREIVNANIFDAKYKVAAVACLAFGMLSPVARLVLHFGFQRLRVDVRWPD